MDYAQARKDHEYLWSTYGPAHDMSGGYVDQDDLDKLLKNPTKVTALGCYENQIQYWFEVGPDREMGIDDKWRDDPRVKAIEKRHMITYIYPRPTRDHWGRLL